MAEIVTRVTRKGQITIPVGIRRELGLGEGDRVAWVREGDHFVGKPTKSIVERTAGALAHYRLERTPTIEEMKEAAHRAIAEDVLAELQD